MNFEKTLQEIRDLQATLQKREKTVARTEEKIRKKKQVLDDACRIVCVRVIKPVSSQDETVVMHIILGSPAVIILDTEQNKFDLPVTLEYSSGREPDECLDEKDIWKIETPLREVLDRELKAEGIPLTFGHLVVPIHYFGK
ncbi:MAG: hypothetical protein AAB794_02430 [Patescibacteria group bacterium]